MKIWNPILKSIPLILLMCFSVNAQDSEMNKALDAYELGDYKSAIALWERNALQGNRDAQYSLGVAYFKGNGVKKNLDTALDWFIKAANSGHTSAMFNLGVAYWQGQGFKTNYSDAVYWWEKAAQLEDTASQYNLGLAFYLGRGTERSISKAEYWLSKAALKKHKEAQRVLEIIGQNNPISNIVTQSTDNSAIESKTNNDNSNRTKNTPDDTKRKKIIYTDYRAAIVSGSNSPLRLQPSIKSPIVQYLPKKTPVKIIGNNEDWAQIQIPGLIKMWVFAEFISESKPNLITADRVRARTMPSTKTESKVVLHLEKDTMVFTHGNSGKWKQVSLVSPKPAWIELSYLIEKNPVTQDWIDRFHSLEKNKKTNLKIHPKHKNVQLMPFQSGWIAEDETIIYAKPNPSSSSIGLLVKNTPVKIIGSKDGWHMINSPFGLDVWIHSKYVDETANGALVSGDRIRVRSFPSTGPDSDVLGLLDKGARLKILRKKGSWLQVKVSPIIPGWLSSEKVVINEDIPDSWQKRWDMIRSENIGD